MSLILFESKKKKKFRIRKHYPMHKSTHKIKKKKNTHTQSAKKKKGASKLFLSYIHLSVRLDFFYVSALASK